MTATRETVTRFAPSPTGHLHLGHAYSALFAAAKAKESGGRFLVRIEDIDQGRARPEFEAAILEDLAWLGLEWEQPVRRQSEHFQDYRAALDALAAIGVLYPCFCTRKDIRAEIAASGLAPHDVPSGPDGPLYPGTCRGLTEAERKRRRDQGKPFALRLDAAAAARAVAGRGPLTWTDLGHDAGTGQVTADPALFGDVVLARKETPTSYHLAVTVDDHVQGVTLVTRGRDLFAATHVQRLLQALLAYPTPAYNHHRLLTAADGRRLAKRDRSATIRALRDAGQSPQDVRRMAGFGPGNDNGNDNGNDKWEGS